MAKDLTDLFGSLPDFVLQGLGPNEIFNIIQQGDPFPLSPGGPEVEDQSFFDEVNQGDPVATQQEMIQAAINQLDAENEGIVPDAVRSAAEVSSALKGSYSSDSIKDVIGDLYGGDIWGDVQAEEEKKRIELFGPGAFEIEKRTLETEPELNLHFDKILTPPTQQELSEAEMIEALSGYGPPPQEEVLEAEMNELISTLAPRAGYDTELKEQEAFRRMGEYTQPFTPGLGAYGEVPTDFPSSPQQYISTADPDADRILRSLRPELGQEDIIAETPYQEDTKEHWERILRDQEEQQTPWSEKLMPIPGLQWGGRYGVVGVSGDGPTEDELPISDDISVEAINEWVLNNQPPDVKDVPTTTDVPTTAPLGGSLSDFIQTRESFTPTENPKEFVSIDSLASNPKNEILEIVDIGGGVKVQLLYNKENESVYARQDEIPDISPVTLYDLGKATSGNEGNTLSLGSFKWNNEAGLWTRPDEVVSTTAQGAVGLPSWGGGVSVADTFRDQGGRSAWKEFYELARLQGMGPQARQPRFADTASQGFGSKWGDFILEQASLGKKGDLGFFDTYLQDEDRDISEANRNKGWGNIAQWSAYAGSDDPAERDKFYGTPRIAQEILTDGSKQDILDLISAAMGSNPDTYGGRALQSSLGREFDHYTMQQQAKGSGELKAGFIGYLNSQMKPNDFTEKDTVAAETAAASTYSIPETAATSSYSSPGIGTQGSETELQKRLRYFQGS